jgi:TonB-dependent SusC/RagA subfamily outer membrane receptor
MIALDYFLKANLYGLLFAGCYVLLLRRHTFFGLNRAYLLVSVALSLVLPLAMLPSQAPESLPLPTGVIVLPAAISPAETATDWEVWGAFIYGAVALAGLITLLIRVSNLLRIIRQSEKVDQGTYTLVLPTDASIPTFSFFRYVVLNPADRDNLLILRHELVHVRQWHSVDVLAVQVLRIVFWASPALWLLERALRQTHEFLADQQASAHERNYARLLVDYSFGLQPASLANGFFNPSLLKQRIQMLQQRATSRWALGKYVLIAPLVLSLLAMTTARDEIAEVVISKTTSNATVISGKVVSAVDGKGLPGATIVVKDQTRGTTTDAKGEYKINASPSESLIFSFVGFTSQVIRVGNRSVIHVALAMESPTANKKKVTAAPATKQPESRSFVAVNEKGKDAHITFYDGVTSRTYPLPDSLRKAKVSVKTFSGQKPLIIIDGIEQLEQDMNELNSDTIESINVLKGDLSATYGVKAMNGVLLITTKKK